MRLTRWKGSGDEQPVEKEERPEEQVRSPGRVVLSCLVSGVKYCRMVDKMGVSLRIWLFQLAKYGGSTGPTKGFYFKRVWAKGRA